MTIYTPTGMNPNGQFNILANGDQLNIGSANISTVIFVATADATIVNTVTETSGIGTGLGTKTIKANTTIIGSTFRVEGSGVYSTKTLTPGNLTIKVKLGSTVIATTTLGSILAAATTLGFQFSGVFTIRTTGATGTVMCNGSIDYATTSTGTRMFGDLNNNGNTTTIDTTSDQIIDVSVTWQTADPANIVKVNEVTIEQLW